MLENLTIIAIMLFGLLVSLVILLIWGPPFFVVELYRRVKAELRALKLIA